ncbi:prepilin peptidase [Siccirubricoccus deserti]|uniref:Prepilin peptidase n=1 Tax=Siccirubricoccus deserti TaxID=2013562 RepID=A0A9X0QZQ1_9PROT|nr:prepilin peptidase [Siccirubricoccus deserti]MBC4016635.1 prepilin peptidase [Siccirubricoccus deserti]
MAFGAVAAVLAGAGLAAAAAALARWLGAGPAGMAPLLAGGGVLAPLAMTLPPSAWPAAAAFATLLLAIAWLDQQAGIVHAALAAPLTLLGLGLAAVEAALPAALAGAALGYGLCRAVEWGFRRLRGQDGLGRGDAWVLGAAGAWVGPDGIGPVLALASTGALLAVLLRGRLPDRQTALPFAPALAAAAWVTWIIGGGVTAWAAGL